MLFLIMRQGFTLVELSIVLVILGLLVGGILAGQSLIRASELRAVSSEYQRYITATMAFRDKYFVIPGDMANATAFWGKDNTNCPSHSGTSATPGTCNGDGNNLIAFSVSANAHGESFQFWKQLALAGLIEGSYSGLSGPSGNAHHVVGTNAPASKLSNGIWGTFDNTALALGDANNFAVNYRNVLVAGGANSSAWNSSPILKPEEAWNIDTKLDDGKPGTGKVVAIWRGSCTNSTSATDYASVYALSTTSVSCALYFPQAF